MTPIVLTLILLSLLIGSATRRGEAKTYYTGAGGNDSTACDQVVSTKPRRTINAGIACLHGGDTLEIAAGEYPELVVAGTGTQDAARTVQPNTSAIPSGTSTSPTTLKAAPGAVVWLRPTVTYPGGGGVITTVTGAQYLRFEGLNLDGRDLHSRALHFHGSHLVYTQAEITRSKGTCVASQTDTDAITLSHLHVHHCGLTSTSSPLPHAIYMCGTNKLVEYSSIHHAPNRGIQLSCEQGGIRDGILRFNRIEEVNVGITLQGNNNLTHDNIIQRVGIGIWLGGGTGGMIRNNTIYDYRPVVSDTYGILVASSSGPLVRDNIIMQFQEIQSTGFNRYLHTTGSAPQMSGNMFDITPTGGLKPAFVASPGAVFVDAPGGDFRLKEGSPALGVGYQGGNLGAQVPEPTPPEPPVTPPQAATLDYQVNGGLWIPVEELVQMPSNVCLRIRGFTPQDLQVCTSGMAR